jgi:hypothetical protein
MDRGWIKDRDWGRRWIQTLRKLPIAAPRRKTTNMRNRGNPSSTLEKSNAYAILSGPLEKGAFGFDSV